MDKQTVIYPHNGILFPEKKEGTTHYSYHNNMNEFQMQYAKWKKSDSKATHCDSIYITFWKKKINRQKD